MQLHMHGLARTIAFDAIRKMSLVCGDVTYSYLLGFVCLLCVAHICLPLVGLVILRGVYM